MAVDNSPVASKSPKLTGSLMVQTASRLVAAIQRGPVSVTSLGLPGRAAAFTPPRPLSLSLPSFPCGMMLPRGDRKLKGDE